MRTKKRILSILMSLVLILSTVMVGTPTTALAAKSKNKMVGKVFTSGKYQYQVTSVKNKTGEVTMTGAKSKSITSLAMPETVKKDGYTFKVTAIANNAFKGYKKLRSVTTNTQLKTIGKNAFNGCSKLSDIDITTTKLTSVGKNALKGISAQAVIEVPSGKVESYQKILKSSGKKSTVVIQSDEKTDKAQPENTTAAVPENNISDAIQPGNNTVEIPVDDIGDVIQQDQTTEAGTTERTTEAVTEQQTTEASTTERTTEAATEQQTTEAGTTEQSTEAIPPEQDTETDVPQHTHSYADWGVTIPATCVATGVETRTCTLCGQEETRTLPKKEHVFGGWVEVWQTSCVQPGLEKRMCDGCGLTESRQIAILEHTLVPTRTTEATCTSGGKQYSECTVCKQVFFHFISSALGHDFEKTYTVDKEPTCNPGSKSRHCSRPDCDAKTDVTVVPAEHKWGEYEIDWVGCTSTGLKHRTCTECKTTESVTTPAQGHVDSGEFVHEKDATCTEEGADRKRCSRCNAILDSKTIPATGHDFSGQVFVEVEATCQTTGLGTVKCSRCDAKQTRVIPKTDHKFADVLTWDKEPGCDFGIQSKHCVDGDCDAYTEWTPIPGTGHNFDGNGHCTNPGCDTIPDINDSLDYRFVWAVAFVADMERCEGFADDQGNHVTSTYKTTIIDIEREGGKPEGKPIKPIYNTIEMTAPAAKDGYVFVGWKDLSNPNGELIKELSYEWTWKSMGRVYEAVYEAQ